MYMRRRHFDIQAVRVPNDKRGAIFPTERGCGVPARLAGGPEILVR